MTSSLGAHRDWRRYHYRAKYTDYTTVELFHSSELGNEPGFYGRASRHIQNGGQKMPSKLHIGNLAYSVSNNDLEELFSKIGVRCKVFPSSWTILQANPKASVSSR